MQVWCLQAAYRGKAELEGGWRLGGSCGLVRWCRLLRQLVSGPAGFVARAGR